MMNKREVQFRKYLFLFLLVILISSLFASFTLATDPYKSILHSAEVPQAPKLKLAGVYQTDIFTGAATYSYPLDVPPGTNKLQPSLSLSYNSQTMKQKSSTVGAGWLLSESYITTKTGKQYIANAFAEEAISTITPSILYSLLGVPGESEESGQTQQMDINGQSIDEGSSA